MLSFPLAVRGSASRTDDRRRHHVCRHKRANVLAQPSVAGSAAPCGDDIRNEALVARVVFVKDRHRLAHVRMRVERGLDLAELDAVAVQLDLVIECGRGTRACRRRGAASDLRCDRRVRRGAREGIGNELLRGQLVAASVSARQPGTADQELAAHADRHRLKPTIDDVEARVRDRAADRRRRRRCASSGSADDQTVVSVGPYMCQSDAPRSRSSCARL